MHYIFVPGSLQGLPSHISPTQNEQINTTFTDKHTIHEVLKCELSAFPLTLQFQTQRIASEHKTKEDLHIAMYPRAGIVLVAYWLINAITCKMHGVLAADHEYL